MVYLSKGNLSDVFKIKNELTNVTLVSALSAAQRPEPQDTVGNEKEAEGRRHFYTVLRLWKGLPIRVADAQSLGSFKSPIEDQLATKNQTIIDGLNGLPSFIHFL